MKTQIFYIIVFFVFLFTSCNQDSDIEPAFIPNTVQLVFNNNTMSFNNSSNVFASDANGYNKEIKMLSIFRRVSDQNRRSVRIKMTNFDIETIKTKNLNNGRLEFNQNVRLDLFPGNMMDLVGKDGEVRVIILSYENGMIRGTFEGIVRNKENSDETYEVKNGKFFIKISEL